jgi:phage virion morphogenesis protein
MAFLQITVDDRDLNNALQKLSDRMSDLTPVMQNIGEYMRGETDANFALERSPDGSPFKFLNPRYARQKEKRKGIRSILQFTGDLRSSIAYQVEPDGGGVAIGTNIKTPGGALSLGAIHQFGAPKRNIPARPFLGVSEANAVEITAIIEEYLAEVVE